MAFQSDTAFELLRQAHLQNRLAHAYLFSGPAGSGKRRLAADLASLVSGTDRDNIFSTTAQSVFLAEPESKSRRIVVEQVRQLEHALQMRAAGGQRKVVIIAEADRLQPQAANAFLKTLEEPPRDSLLLLLSALPEALPDTIVSRCIAISLAGGEDRQSLPETAELIELLRQSAAEKGSNIRSAFQLAQEFQALLRNVREQIKAETDEALKREEARYRNTTDGAWLDDREQYYKALGESRYLERRAGLIETLLMWWTDALRAAEGVDKRDLPEAQNETSAVAKRFNTTEILRRIRSLEELRDHLGRNIQEALAIEVVFLTIFIGT